MTFYNNNPEMRMFSFAHGDMLRFKTFPRKVYLDENKENKEVSL